MEQTSNFVNLITLFISKSKKKNHENQFQDINIFGSSKDCAADIVKYVYENCKRIEKNIQCKYA